MSNKDSTNLIQLSFCRDELRLVGNALNEVCNGIHLTDDEFHARLGASREEALSLLQRVAESLGDDRV
jgi:hypothetical protein